MSLVSDERVEDLLAFEKQAEVEIDLLRAENATLLKRVKQLTETRIELSKSQAELRAALEEIMRQPRGSDRYEIARAALEETK